MSAGMEDATARSNGDLRRDTRVESLLNAWGLDYEFDPAYPLSKIDATDEGLQVRKTEHRAPRETREEYATQMRGGALFPPVVLNHKGHLIDGNTRSAAAEHNGEETFPAYLVKLPRLDFGPMIGAALNQMGGKRLTAEEAYAAAERMMNEGYADEAIARALGRSRQQVNNYRRERRFGLAAERMGLDDLKLGHTVKRHLAEITHDEPFRQAADLAARAKMAPKDVQEMVSAVSEARSEREELEVIGGYATKFRPTGPPPRRAAPIRAATQAGRAIDRFLEKVGDVPVPELAPAAVREDLEPKWRRVYGLAGEVLAAFAENGQ